MAHIQVRIWIRYVSRKESLDVPTSVLVDRLTTDMYDLDWTCYQTIAAFNQIPIMRP